LKGGIKMANMSYCRFENTLIDLQECITALEDREISSDREKRKAKELLKTIAEFLINEGLLVTDNDEDIRVYYSAIDDLIEECGDNEEE
jgi:deoxyhypusine synthase